MDTSFFFGKGGGQVNKRVNTGLQKQANATCA